MNNAIIKKTHTNVTSELHQLRLSDRAWVMDRVEVLLNPFYRKDLGEMFQDAEKIEWADVLEGLPRVAINKACIDWHRTGPKSQAGKLIKPCAGDIYQRAVNFIPKPKIVYEQPMAADEEPLEQVSAKVVSEKRASEAQRIASEVGFKLKDHRRKVGADND